VLPEVRALLERANRRGLGLAIVRGIVEAHSGQTTVHNVAGGCRFEVVLPVARRSEAA
jgi:signal transduction histidine kinase